MVTAPRLKISETVFNGERLIEDQLPAAVRENMDGGTLERSE